jgi:hypothetical protein
MAGNVATMKLKGVWCWHWTKHRAAVVVALEAEVIQVGRVRISPFINGYTTRMMVL